MGRTGNTLPKEEKPEFGVLGNETQGPVWPRLVLLSPTPALSQQTQSNQMSLWVTDCGRGFSIFFLKLRFSISGLRK